MDNLPDNFSLPSSLNSTLNEFLKKNFEATDLEKAIVHSIIYGNVGETMISDIITNVLEHQKKVYHRKVLIEKIGQGPDENTGFEPYIG